MLAMVSKCPHLKFHCPIGSIEAEALPFYRSLANKIAGKTFYRQTVLPAPRQPRKIIAGSPFCRENKRWGTVLPAPRFAGKMIAGNPICRENKRRRTVLPGNRFTGVSFCRAPLLGFN
jgi:hypothetical protein